MKKIMLTAIAAMTALSMVPSQADEGFSVSGTIIAPAPQTKAIALSATEGLNPCGAPDPDLGSTQGVDGYWIALPEGSAGLAAAVTSDAVDIDVWYYDEGCGGLYDYNAMATDLTANETGTVPEGAAFAIVDLAVGAAANFTFTLS
jgi:hypothetical protein